MSFPRHFYRLLGSIALGFFLGEWSLHAATLPPGFTETQLGSNVGSSPTAMGFAPDGRLFVCLQGGQLRVISNGILLPTPFVTVTTTSAGERGLLGVAFDPNFAGNQFVYVYYTIPGSPAHNRVSRFTANGDVAVAGSETPLLDLDDLDDTDTGHNGGAIHFGPDGKLYVAVGENENSANAQLLTNRLGKILRINANGTIPSDNPTSFPGIAGSPSGNNQAIWAVGLRNPFTFGIQPGTGRLFINDVGLNTWEEINDGIAGSNYGWGLCEGLCSPPNANYRDPLFEYGHGSGGTTGCAIIGAAFYNPAVTQFPVSYVGKYFFGDLCSGWIRVFDPSTNTASAFATGVSTLIDLKVGSEGSLYYLTQGSGGQVWKVSGPPTATPTPTPTPIPIALTGTISYCSNPVPGPVPNVTLNLTGSASGSTASDGSGNYLFSALASGGSYTVTPTKAALPPGSGSINTVDMVAAQRHFLHIATPLTGCRLTAADVNGDTSVNTVDVIAIQRFFLGSTFGIANTGQSKFNPASRTYPGLFSSQNAQNYDTLVFGDIALPFAERLGGPSQTAAGDGASAGEVAATVAEVALPQVAEGQIRTPKAFAIGAVSRVESKSNFIAAVRTTAIDGKNKLVGFQGDFTFDERAVTFQSEPVQKAGMTGGNWNVSGNVLAGRGPIRTLRISAYSNDFTPLSGEGTLFELRMTRLNKAAGTQLLWAPPPDEFIFIDADLKTQKPRDAVAGVVGALNR